MLYEFAIEKFASFHLGIEALSHIKTKLGPIQLSLQVK